MFRIVLIICVLCSLNAVGQADVSGSLKGETDREPLMFANVSLFNSQTNDYVKGVQTDLEGKFVLSAIPKGTYYLKASFVGFHDLQKKDIVVEDGKNIDLGTLLLPATGTLLEEVVVAGTKPAMELQMDRKVF
ncbi:MAG: carboxypeptidase-like regulatory domain-containing protein [Leadbetterella sp.]|nr:carboxypeptidase-like regulatory domain-containing protein [Leadbetterella sp.]